MLLPDRDRVPPPFDPALHGEYRASVYACHNYRLRPGILNAPFDEWIAARGHETYAFLTAYNPYSDRNGSRADNLARAQVLSRWVRDRAYDHHPAAATDPTGAWPEEVGLIIMGIDLPTALQIGMDLHQNAILWGTVGEAPTVLWSLCDLYG